MAFECSLWLTLTVTLILPVVTNGGTLPASTLCDSGSELSEHGQATGFVLDRLTESKLKTWNSILEIVMARDGGGRPVHPRLHALYQQAAGSGHVIFVELSMQTRSYSSLGASKVESQSDNPQRTTIVMRLNLGMVGRALICERNRRANGFIPFAGLRMKERYAEVLGHELTHVVLLLTEPEYLHFYRERKAKVHGSSPDSQSIDILTSLIEGPAEAAEKEIWAELKGRRTVGR